MPELNDTRFGRIEFIDEDVVTFPEGLVGFPQMNSFLVLSSKPDSPFRWLQSIEAPAIALLVADPLAFEPEYAPKLDESGQSWAESQGSLLLLTTASIPRGKPDELTLNLAGPILIGTESRIGKQFVLDDEAYTIKHRVIRQTSADTDKVAA